MSLQTLTFVLTIAKAWKLNDAWISTPTLGWVLNRDAFVVFMAVTGAYEVNHASSFCDDLPGAFKVRSHLSSL